MRDILVSRSAALLLLRFAGLIADIKFDFGLDHIALFDSWRLNEKEDTSFSILMAPF